MRTAAAVAAVALLGGAARAAQAPSFVVQADVKIGHFAVKRDGTLAGAQRAFGQPTSVRRSQAGCVASWRSVGLVIEVYNLGGHDPCIPRYGFFARAFLAGPRWRTAVGLRIGDPVSRLRRLYPAARFHAGLRHFRPAGWWLVPRYSAIGAGGWYAGLMATTRNGAVSTLQVRYAAGGD